MSIISKQIEIILGEEDSSNHDLFTKAVNHLGIPANLSSFDDCGKMQLFLDDQKPAASPDMIFMNIDLSAKNGQSCLREVRQNPKYENTPIIVFANSFTPIDVKESRRFGANLYINKPTGLNELIVLLEKIFSPRWQKMLNIA